MPWAAKLLQFWNTIIWLCQTEHQNQQCWYHFTPGYLCLSNKGQISLQLQVADSYSLVSGLYIKIRSLSVFPPFPAHSVTFCKRKGRVRIIGYSVVWCDDWEAELGTSLNHYLLHVPACTNRLWNLFHFCLLISLDFGSTCSSQLWWCSALSSGSSKLSHPHRDGWLAATMIFKHNLDLEKENTFLLIIHSHI